MSAFASLLISELVSHFIGRERIDWLKFLDESIALLVGAIFIRKAYVQIDGIIHHLHRQSTSSEALGSHELLPL